MSLKALTRAEFLSAVGLLKEIDPITDEAYKFVEAKERLNPSQGAAADSHWHLCLGGDTEIVTRQGIKPICETVGLTEILVPEQKQGRRGRFMECNVSSYGVAPTLNISLRRHKQIKVVTCTPAHRWILVDGECKLAEKIVVGDELRSLWATVGYKMKPTPFAFPQGFVFGDGTHRLEGRPCHLDLYHNGKDEVMLPFFAGHDIKEKININGMKFTQIRSLPRLWKEFPDYRESRSFLLSWLAGYFAADGCVDQRGYCSLASASREAVSFARDILAICGITYGKIKSQVQSGTYPHGATYKNRIMYSIRFSAYDAPMWFFLLDRHRERVIENVHRRQLVERVWKVTSISCGKPQEVFCAIVPKHGVFGLSDQLMTGNSFHGSQFPGNEPLACGRRMLYTMMDSPRRPIGRWLQQVADAGKDIENRIVGKWYQAGYLVSAPPPPFGKLQTTYEDSEHWLTSTVDAEVLPLRSDQIVVTEIKCLSGETKVVTKKGLYKIKDLAGHSATIINGKGYWQKVPFLKIGKDRLWAVNLKCGKWTKTIYATKDHRWFFDKHNNKSARSSTECLTVNLKPGMQLTRRIPRTSLAQSIPSPIGIARGLVFGDGCSFNDKSGGSVLDLFKEKNLAFIKYFPECKKYVLKGQLYKGKLTDGGVRILGFPTSYKTEFPKLNEGTSYLYGWLAGYFAADGTVSKTGQIMLDSVDLESLEFFRDLCHSLGITTKKIYTLKPIDQMIPNGKVLSGWQAYRLAIDADSLSEEFFLMEHHLDRWKACQERAPKRFQNWTVISSEPTNSIEDVYCAVVEGTEKFVLEDFILTGNSKFARDISKMQRMVLGPVPANVKQLKTQIALSREVGPRKLLRCHNSGRLAIKIGVRNKQDVIVCPLHGHENCLHEVIIRPPDYGRLYYVSRDDPTQVKEFFYEYDAEFMEVGRVRLKTYQAYWLRGELPQTDFKGKHPFSWNWTTAESPCRWCDFGTNVGNRTCQADHKKAVENGKPTLLAESEAIVEAKAVRPDYSYDLVRAAVERRWIKG